MEKEGQVVIISTPGIGNMVPAVEFAHHLTRRHPLMAASVFIISVPHRPLVDDYVNGHARSNAIDGGHVHLVRLPSVDPPPTHQYQSTIAFLSSMFEKNIPIVKHAITNLLFNSNSTADSASQSEPAIPLIGLFIDMFSTPMIDVARDLGVPCYLFFASPATFLGLVLHLPTLHATLTTEFDEPSTELSIPCFKNPVPVRVLPHSVLQRKEDAYAWFLNHAVRYRETDGIVINTFSELEPFALHSLSASDIPPVYPVGPILDFQGPARWDPDGTQHQGIMEWLDRQPTSSVVFLCFGSMGSLSMAQVSEIARGLEFSGQRFLWSLRRPAGAQLELPSDYPNLEEALPDGFLKRTAEMGLVCGWAPQVSILSHKAIGGFVSHCGWNSILESMWYGVPVATWPLYAEQQMNAFEMVKELGLAVEIKLDYRYNGSDLVRAEELERGLRRLMEGDGEVRRRVTEMSEMGKNALEENGSSHKFLGHLIDKLLK